MAHSTHATRRLLLAGGFALAVAAAPTVIALSAPGAPAPAVAACPAGEVENTATGACKPLTDQSPTTFNPINPEKAKLEPNEITSSISGNVGSLPEVNGVPCSGTHGGGSGTGECIGLAQEQAPTLKVPLPPE